MFHGNCANEWSQVHLCKDKNNNNKTQLQHSALRNHLVKLENETENARHATLGKIAGDQIRDARIAKYGTQIKLANALNVKLDVIRSYESGTVVPDQQILNKLTKTLNIKIIRKNVDSVNG
jgi:ribosome-binding protein aMBF1 (putative translation factor)